MAILNFLRMLSDLTFYASFAGFLTWRPGASSLLLPLLLQSACFGLSSVLGDSRGRRIASLLPAVLYLCLPQLPLSVRLALLPSALYVLYMAWCGEYSLSWDRQERNFSVFWKAYLPTAGVCLLIGQWNAVLSGSLPYCVLTLLTSVVLLRALRHDPEVYLQGGNLALNLLCVAIPAAVAWLFSSQWLLDAMARLLRAFYLELCAPLLSALFMALAYLFFGLFHLLGRLLALFGASASSQKLELALGSVQDTLGETFSPVGDSSQLIERIFLILGLLLTAFLLFRLFRWLSRRDVEHSAGGPWTVTRSTPDGQDRPYGAVLPTAPVLRIRSQYRKFLKLYREQGGSFDSSRTSGEIQAMAGTVFSDAEAIAEMRDLYIRARYHNQGTQRDAARMRQLYLLLKKG